jgi:hypothetical protein
MAKPASQKTGSHLIGKHIPKIRRCASVRFSGPVRVVMAMQKTGAPKWNLFPA